MSKMLSKTPKPLNRFNSLPVNEQQRGRMDRIRQLVKRLFLESRHLCPEGQYLDQAHEQLEIVHMLLNKSISHDWEGSSDQIATDDPVLAPSFDVEALCEALDADVLEPDYPIEAVDQELRDMGVDPDELGQRGEELVQGLMAEKEGGGDMSKRCNLCKGKVYLGYPVYLFAESERERYGGLYGDTIHVVKKIEQVNDKEDADITICGCCKDVIERATWRPT